MWGAPRRWFGRFSRTDPVAEPAGDDRSRPRCQFIGVYFDAANTPIYQACQRRGAYVMTRRCCGERTVLCRSHLKVAKASEWSECQVCQHIALSWEDCAASLARLPRRS